ncbi:MAG: SurA N-terminal domain-containing protein [Smithellaceae bacterium]|nr:SurA N-terminal domain-containing protein [Smithellaceae bacterium]
MLDLMRKHARNWIMKVLLGIIIVVFVFYFGSIRREQEALTIATINGKSLVHVNFQKEYGDLIDFYRRQFGPNLNEDIIKALNLKQQAFDNMIYKALALQKAEDWKVTITDEEVRQSILSNPGFQRNGVFEQRVYEQTLRMNRMTSADFENSQRDLLTMTRLEAILVSAATVSERELRDLNSSQNEEVSLEAIVVSPKEFLKKVQPNTDEMEKFLKEHGNLFQVPQQYQLKYISFPATQYDNQVKVSREEIDAAYERIIASEKAQPGFATGSKPPAGVSKDRIGADLKRQKMIQAAQEAAKKAYEIIYQEESLEKYAEEMKIDVKITEFFTLARPVPALAGISDLPKSVPGMQKGEISKVMADNNGFYILKVSDKKPPYIPPFNDIRNEVQKRYTENQAETLSRTAAEDIADQLRKGADWRSIVLKDGMKRVDSGFFRPGSLIPALGNAPKEMNEAIFVLSKKKPYPDRPYVLADGNFVIFHLKDRRYVKEDAFEANREALTSSFSQMKRQEIIRSWIDDYKTSLIKDGKLKIKKEAKDI